MFPPVHITTIMWKSFLIISVLVFCTACQEACEKSVENVNEDNQCDSKMKNNFINKVKMMKIAQNVMMPQVGYGTWKVMGDDPIYKVDYCILSTNNRNLFRY